MDMNVLLGTPGYVHEPKHITPTNPRAPRVAKLTLERFNTAPYEFTTLGISNQYNLSASAAWDMIRRWIERELIVSIQKKRGHDTLFRKIVHSVEVPLSKKERDSMDVTRQVVERKPPTRPVIRYVDRLPPTFTRALAAEIWQVTDSTASSRLKSARQIKLIEVNGKKGQWKKVQK